MHFRYIAIISGAVAALAIWAEETKKPIDYEIVGHVVRPQPVDQADSRDEDLKLPPGFQVHKFADGLGNPRMIAVAGDGSVYVTRRDEGDCVLLRDNDSDGRADARQVVARREGLHGIAIHKDRVYFTTVKEILVADRNQDGTLGELRTVVADLPDGGQHPNRTIFFGPDERMYVTVGSSCNACRETNPEHATILLFSPDYRSRQVIASGLRNTIGMDWHPETKELWAMDHGTDWLGDEAQKEELNLIEPGRFYGWPYLYEDNQPNLRVAKPKDKTWEQIAAEATPPVLTYTAHAAPMQFVFYRGNQFPAEYRGDAFITMRGSWNRRPPSGYEVVRLHFEKGKPVRFEPFLTGFLTQQGEGWKYLGRPVGLAFTPDGGMLVGDDSNGVIYRVWHEQGTRTRTRQASKP